MSQRDSLGNTLVVALVLCLVCSSLVSFAAVGLKPFQDINKQLDVQKNILAATELAKDQLGIAPDRLKKSQVDDLFANIQTKMVNLDSGEFVDASQEEIDKFDPRKAARDPAQNEPIDSETYAIGIADREKVTKVYLVWSDDKKLQQVVLPVYGKGLWSTLYGFLAIKSDLQTVKGITFYEHGETPGLGGEVDNPRWKQQWAGLKLYDDKGQPAVAVNKGPAPIGTTHLVDGLSGATLTSRGVTHLVQYWISDEGFGPFLKHLKEHPPEAPAGDPASPQGDDAKSGKAKSGDAKSGKANSGDATDAGDKKPENETKEQ